MMKLTDLGIAIVGNKDQTAIMRLAGVKRYIIIEEDDRAIREKVRDAVSEFSEDTSIGIVMIPESWMSYVDDMVKRIRAGKKTPTIIIEYPAKYEAEKRDVREFYKSYTKSLIGFNVEI